MEEAGRIRRGYFVEGLGAAQFALPVPSSDCAPCARPTTALVVHLLAATDPAQPYGAALSWRDGGG